MGEILVSPCNAESQIKSSHSLQIRETLASEMGTVFFYNRQFNSRHVNIENVQAINLQRKSSIVIIICYGVF